MAAWDAEHRRSAQRREVRARLLRSWTRENLLRELLAAERAVSDDLRRQLGRERERNQALREIIEAPIYGSPTLPQEAALRCSCGERRAR